MSESQIVIDLRELLAIERRKNEDLWSTIRSQDIAIKELQAVVKSLCSADSGAGVLSALLLH